VTSRELADDLYGLFLTGLWAHARACRALTTLLDGLQEKDEIQAHLEEGRELEAQALILNTLNRRPWEAGD